MERCFLISLLLAAVSFSETTTQTDWSGGGGVSGPVTEWGDNYDVSSTMDSEGGVLQIEAAIPLKHVVSDSFEGARSVYSVDIDGDGDMDILGAARDASDITWWENENGSGAVWVEHLIDGNVWAASTVYSADIDGDGDMDVLGAEYYDKDIIWWENENGSGDTWIVHTVDSDFDGANSIYAADIDGDGNKDILGASTTVDEISWWEVSDGHFSEAVLESSILDAGQVNSWNTFLSNSEIPSGTSVGFQFRSSADSENMGLWSDTVFSSVISLSDILVDSTQYIQYRVILKTFDPAKTPVLEDLSFNYYCLGINENDVSCWSLHFSENPSDSYLSAVFAVPEAGMVDLQLYDVSGRVIAEVSQEFPTGIHSLNFYGLSEGVYFCVMRADDFSVTEKVVVL